jgi:NADP-dependent aldehyde dehydrogenase
MLFPVGPVAVFTASNFPLAFSTAGGDTASALAAGCPVIVKAHEGHLGTNQLVADAIIRAAKKTAMPEGVFSSVQSFKYEIGKKLVTDAAIKAVAFTGSKKGGNALIELCSKRPEPIPVYAEMGSVNPVLLLPYKLRNDSPALAKTFADSISKGSGQFCTNPGVLIGIKGDSLTHFAKRLTAGLKKIKPEPMLNEKIWRQYHLRKNEICYEEGVKILCNGNHYDKKVQGTLVSVSAETFLGNPSLQHEIFGPMSVLVECENIFEMENVVNAMSGQLTLTVMASDIDIKMFDSFLSGLRENAGRIIFNGPPTGVEVCNAMHHGGTYPASSNSKYTSVGQDAIKRFVHPVAFQSCPQSLLPEELKDENPLRILRCTDGELSRKQVDNFVLV